MLRPKRTFSTKLKIFIMKLIRSGIYPIAILSALILLQGCAAKKAVPQNAATPATPAPVAAAAPPAETPKPQSDQDTKPTPPAVEKPDYTFTNIQFEFNSAILKTGSYEFLDKAAAAMKMDASAKFVLNGYASAEGTDEHNIRLSIDRANSVKAYLVNSGVSGANLSAMGYGETNPIADNTTEAGRVLNRRVEIKKKD